MAILNMFLKFGRIWITFIALATFYFLIGWIANFYIFLVVFSFLFDQSFTGFLYFWLLNIKYNVFTIFHPNKVYKYQNKKVRNYYKWKFSLCPYIKIFLPKLLFLLLGMAFKNKISFGGLFHPKKTFFPRYNFCQLKNIFLMILRNDKL